MIILLPQQPGRPDNTLPGSTTFWVVVWIPGYGWRYVAVDPNLSIDNSLPGSINRPSNELPGNQPGADNSLPGSANRPNQGLPATPQPKS